MVLARSPVLYYSTAKSDQSWLVEVSFLSATIHECNWTRPSASVDTDAADTDVSTRSNTAVVKGVGKFGIICDSSNHVTGIVIGTLRFD